MKSKTSWAGVAAILAGASGIVTAVTSGDWSHIQEAIASIAAGIGLILAQDAQPKE